MGKQKTRSVFAIITVVLIVVTMLLFARVSANVTVLSNFNQQNVIINIPGINVGDIEININTNDNDSSKKYELIKDIVESLIGMIISGSVSIVTGKFALTGKWIVKKE